MVFTLIYTPCLGTGGHDPQGDPQPGLDRLRLVYGLGLAWLMAWFTVLGGQALGFA